MKAFLRSARIAPKKASIIADLVRGMPVIDALEALGNTHKKAARMLEKLIASAAANARHGSNQSPSDLIVKTIVVNKALTYHRGVPMARGRMRPMRKFTSHIEVVLGFPADAIEKEGNPASKKQKAPVASATEKSTGTRKKPSAARTSNVSAAS